MNCPSCGNKMYHKKENHNIDDNSIMVGGHVTWMKVLYFLPICKVCNDRKGNLFQVYGTTQGNGEKTFLQAFHNSIQRPVCMGKNNLLKIIK